MSDARDTATKPTLYEYAADLALRLAKDTIDHPTALVVGILGFAAEDDRLDKHQRSMCQNWLDRLVDEEGNPKDDKGRDAWQWASEENAINHYGSLSHIRAEDDRAVLIIEVLRRVADHKTRDELRVMLVPHAESYIDFLLDELYSSLAAGEATAAHEQADGGEA